MEDDPDSQLIYHTALEHAGFSVTVADNGEDAVRLGTHAPPDLIVMDIVLPRLDGWRAIAALRGDEAARGVPIVVITADLPQKARKRASELGCRACLGKPVSPSELLDIVRDLLESQ